MDAGYYLAAKRRRDIAVVREKIFSGTTLREYALCGLGIHSDTSCIMHLHRACIIIEANFDYRTLSRNDTPESTQICIRILSSRRSTGVTGMRVSPGIVFSAHISLGMRVSPHMYH